MATSTTPFSEITTSHKLLALTDSSSASTSETTISLNTNGKAVKLDHLGPVVVNQDGTLSRINNWGEMSEIERTSTLRVLGKRNKLRLEKVRQKQEGVVVKEA